MGKMLASLSLDLDNKWSYMKTHGDAGWESFPSYLDLVVPRVLRVLGEQGLKITFFVVGQDAAIEENHVALRMLSDAGHEIGNHSFHHEPWLHLYSEEQISEEFTRAEEAIKQATGQRTRGFRGPGFSFSPAVLRELVSRGYSYDASTFPTFLGPVARMYYFFTANLSREERAERKQLFGNLREGFRPLRPYLWKELPGEILEIPVTTMPLLKVPIHVSYLLYLAQFSRPLAMIYCRMAFFLCKVMRVEPSILLHPLDFMGCDDDSDLAFFPAMRSPSEEKMAFVGKVLELMQKKFEIVPMAEHARIANQRLSTHATRQPYATRVEASPGRGDAS